MRILRYFLVAAGGSILTSTWLHNSLTGTMLLAIFGGIGAAALIYAGEQIARRTLKLTDRQFMQYGVCPVCETHGVLEEVTSGDDHTLVKCNNCMERFDIRPSETGPIVLRLGKDRNA